MGDSYEDKGAADSATYEFVAGVTSVAVPALTPAEPQVVRWTVSVNGAEGQTAHTWDLPDHTFLSGTSTSFLELACEHSQPRTFDGVMLGDGESYSMTVAHEAFDCTRDVLVDDGSTYDAETIALCRQVVIDGAGLISDACAELAPASAEQGQRKFRSRCGVCHGNEPMARRSVGPNLYGVYERSVGTEDYNYSSAVRRYAEEHPMDLWDFDSLNAWLANPRDKISGTRMTVKISSTKDRVNIIAYLATLREGGRAIVTTEDGVPSTDDEREGDPEAGRQAFNNTCRTCHDFRDGNPSRLAPNLFGVVGRQVGSHHDYTGRYTTALSNNGDTVWTPEMLDRWIQMPDQVFSGSAMQLFGGVSDAGVRRDIVAFLSTLRAE